MPDWNRERRSFREDAHWDRSDYGPYERYAGPHESHYHPDGDFHPDYLHWREEQLRMHDRDYHAWREERRRAYDHHYMTGRGAGWSGGRHNMSRGMPAQDTGLGVGGSYRPVRSGYGRGGDEPSGALEPPGAMRRW